jgi:hypothetical protein
MTIHYHGDPKREDVIVDLRGRCFCASFAAPARTALMHKHGQSVMLDNGAFSKWKSGWKGADWRAYYKWVDRWLDCPSTWAVIPDVIDGPVPAQDALIYEWPFGNSGAPVWHVNEPLHRLERLCDHWPLVCVGSAGRYKRVLSRNWQIRMDRAFNRLASNGRIPRLHMMRGQALLGERWPFYSVDSSVVARNHWRTANKLGDAAEMVARLDAKQCALEWKSVQPAADFFEHDVE